MVKAVDRLLICIVLKRHTLVFHVVKACATRLNIVVWSFQLLLLRRSHFLKTIGYIFLKHTKLSCVVLQQKSAGMFGPLVVNTN
ncbi:MAG: hypothetical protein C4326_09110 [Ignavibacteria bacterium]